MLQKLRGNNQKGFTLIELMIVIAIIGILAAIAIPNFISYRDKAYCSRAEQDAKSMLAALASYFSEPEHTAMPSINDLITLEDLSLNNPKSPTFNIAAGSTVAGKTITATVTDESNRCPRNTTYSSSLGGNSIGSWN